MRVVVSMIDKYIVVDGEARQVAFNGLAEEGLQGMSWDGTTGHRWYDLLAQRTPEFFDDEGIVRPFIELWQTSVPPEPEIPEPPPAQEVMAEELWMAAEPELPLEPLPPPPMPMFHAWDDPPPEGQEKLPPPPDPEPPPPAKEDAPQMPAFQPMDEEEDGA